MVAYALGPTACWRGSTGSCSAGRPNSSTGHITGPLAASRRPAGDIFRTSGPADPAAGLIKRYGHDRRHMSLGQGRETPARAFLRGRRPPGVGVVACGRTGEQYRVRCGGGGGGCHFWDLTTPAHLHFHRLYTDACVGPNAGHRREGRTHRAADTQNTPDNMRCIRCGYVIGGRFDGVARDRPGRRRHPGLPPSGRATRSVEYRIGMPAGLHGGGRIDRHDGFCAPSAGACHGYARTGKTGPAGPFRPSWRKTPV